MEKSVFYKSYTQSNSLDSLLFVGHRPAPSLAIQVLLNLFPYTDMDETVLALKSIMQLQSSWEPGAPYPAYKVDVGILEHIMAAAARSGAFEVNILVWDLVDLLGYEPTEFMYENTIHGFARVPQQDHNVFGVLGEMEERGFTPSRALIRSLSRYLRYVVGISRYSRMNCFHLMFFFFFPVIPADEWTTPIVFSKRRRIHKTKPKSHWLR
jgi:hypothetical protein